MKQKQRIPAPCSMDFVGRKFPRRRDPGFRVYPLLEVRRPSQGPVLHTRIHQINLYYSPEFADFAGIPIDTVACPVRAALVREVSPPGSQECPAVSLVFQEECRAVSLEWVSRRCPHALNAGITASSPASACGRIAQAILHPSPTPADPNFLQQLMQVTTPDVLP